MCDTFIMVAQLQRHIVIDMSERGNPHRERVETVRAEIQFMSGGLIAVGIAVFLAVPAISQSKTATALMLCFAISVPCLSTIVLMLRTHAIVPTAGEYDDCFDPAPFSPPRWLWVLHAAGFTTGVAGIALLLFDFWWVCGALFTAFAVVGLFTYLVYGRFLEDMEMAAAMQAKERARVQKILDETGHYDPANDPGRSQLLRPVDPTLRRLRDTAYAYATFNPVASGCFLISGKVHRHGLEIGRTFVSHVDRDKSGSRGLFIELVLFENKDAFDRFARNELKLPAGFSAVTMSNGAADSAQYQNGILVFVEPKLNGEETHESKNIDVAGQSFVFQPKLPWWRRMIGGRRQREKYVDQMSQMHDEWATETYGDGSEEHARTYRNGPSTRRKRIPDICISLFSVPYRISEWLSQVWPRSRRCLLSPVIAAPSPTVLRQWSRCPATWRSFMERCVKECQLFCRSRKQDVFRRSRR